MESVTDPWTAIGATIAGILIATVTYLKTNGRKNNSDPHEATAGLFVDRETIRHISQNLERIADCCERMADKRQDAMASSITQMLELMREREKRREP